MKCTKLLADWQPPHPEIGPIVDELGAHLHRIGALVKALGSDDTSRIIDDYNAAALVAVIKLQRVRLGVKHG